MIRHDPLLVNGFLSRAKVELMAAKGQWELAAKEAGAYETEHYEALEEDLARLIGELELLCQSANVHANILRTKMLTRVAEPGKLQEMNGK